jgi:hypothetical protein
MIILNLSSSKIAGTSQTSYEHMWNASKISMRQAAAVQPEASRYTDCAIPAHKVTIVAKGNVHTLECDFRMPKYKDLEC